MDGFNGGGPKTESKPLQDIVPLMKSSLVRTLRVHVFFEGFTSYLTELVPEEDFRCSLLRLLFSFWKLGC